MAIEESKILEKYFDKIAPNYQFMNKLLSLNLDNGWRQNLLNRANLKQDDIVLDVACGTCDILSTLKNFSEKSNIEITYIGLDLSFGMLETSKRNNVPFELIRGNGICFPFKNDSINLITISFGYRNMPTHSQFLQEAFRVLKPGGQLLILELTQPENPVIRFGNQIYLRTILPLVSSAFGRDKQAYSYLAESIRAFPNQKIVQSDLSKHGFNPSSYHLLNFGITTLFEAFKPSEAKITKPTEN
ncbi:MAG: ubiquinone/menaquinone biosynthesis methyltransferase [bacterium]|nr:ubiquinone/menaquinone biosynthesis methyltransferase [bacterium]